MTHHESTEWRAYLARMTDRALADAVDGFVGRVRDVGLQSEPSAMPLEDGSMHLAWDSGPHHFDVDVHPDSSFDWFYLDRSTNALAGTEDERETRMTDDLVRCLRMVAQ